MFLCFKVGKSANSVDNSKKIDDAWRTANNKNCRARNFPQKPAAQKTLVLHTGDITSAIFGKGKVKRLTTCMKNYALIKPIELFEENAK